MKTSFKWVEHLSIHGVRHIFTGYGNRFAKVFWSIVVLSSMAGFSFYNYQLYMKMNEIPDIHVRTKQKFTSKIPFPAITICNPLFAKNHLVDFYNNSKRIRIKPEKSYNIPIQEQNYIASNMHFCVPGAGNLISHHVINRTDNNIVKLLDESILLINETLLNCGYKDILNDCSKFFNRVLTDRGFCYTFNLMGFNTIFNNKTISEDFSSYKRSKIAKSMDLFNRLSNEKIDDNNEHFIWSLDKGFEKNHEPDSVPVKAEKGKTVSTNIILREADIKNVCMIIGNVFSFYIHLPNEMMLPVHQEYFVEFNKKSDVLLTAKSYRADDGLRSFTPRNRGCYFEGEKKLKFFKTYSKALCEFECMTNYTLKECGCVKFSMPRSQGTPVCTVDKADCYFEAMKKWPDYEHVKDRFEATCGCLKTCNDIKYEVKFQKTSASDNVLLIMEMYNFSKGDAVSRISFMFDDFEIVEFEEYAAYSLYNFVADVGGLLGFFLGCSILSIIEIVYFISETCFSKLKDLFIGQRRSQRKKNAIQSISKEVSNMEFIKGYKAVSNQVMFNPKRFHQRTTVKSFYQN